MLHDFMCFLHAFSYAQTLILVKLILVKLTSFLVIAPSPELGSGRYQVEMLPISLPDLPIPTRDQKSTIRPEFLKF